MVTVPPSLTSKNCANLRMRAAFAAKQKVSYLFGVAVLTFTRQENFMAKKPRHILKYLEDPNTWDKSAFETAIRAEVEGGTGALTASDEFLIGSLVLVVDSLLTAQINIAEAGHVTVYGNNEGVTAWYKIRTEMTDKAIKILAELGLVARGRPKIANKVTDVDELFATA